MTRTGDKYPDFAQAVCLDLATQNWSVMAGDILGSKGFPGLVFYSWGYRPLEQGARGLRYGFDQFNIIDHWAGVR